MSTENNLDPIFKNSLKILSDLIAFKTISGENNNSLINYCNEILNKLGATSFKTYDDEKKRVNLFATLKAKNPSKKKSIIFSGHTDVVPVSKDWNTDPFVATIKDEKVFGRGACDMKGFIACTLAYAPIFSKTNLDRDIHFSFTFDEETACQGAPLLINELKKKIIQNKKFIFNNKNHDLVDELKKKGILNNNILDAFNKIPRELFVNEKFANLSYENIPLPIDCEQTISQPYVVAFMIDCLKLKKINSVLEIGTGTGYQTALLSYLCKHVFTIEIFEKLINQAKINHTKLNLKNISYLLGDGSNGWNKPILFDSIIISAASKKVPLQLLKTLKTKGKIIFPNEYFPRQQKLLLLKKLNERNYSTQELFDVSFVPLL